MLPRRCARDSSERYGLRNRPGRMLFGTGFVTPFTVLATAPVTPLSVFVAALVRPETVLLTAPAVPFAVLATPPAIVVTVPVAAGPSVVEPVPEVLAVRVPPPASCNASRNEM